MSDFYTPSDLDQASDAWGANCGPGSLAAACGVPLARVFDAVGDKPQGGLFPEPRTFRGYMGIIQMKGALVRLGVEIGQVWRSPPAAEFREALAKREPWSTSPALVCILWSGPWNGTRGAFVHRHWVATQGPWVYDVNFHHALEIKTIHAAETPVRYSERTEYHSGGWLPIEAWERGIVPRLMPPRGDGWMVQWAATVKP